MKLYFTRHGETIENQQKIIQGHLEGTLSELGKEQAKRLAERLKNEPLDAIYSSDLRRAADTAKEVKIFHSNTQLILVRELRERHHGPIQGRKESELTKEQLALESNPYFKPEGGESQFDVYQRMEKFFTEIYERHRNENVLFVTHGATGRALACKLKYLPIDQFLSFKGLKNTSLSIFEVNDLNYTEILYNCVKHLKEN
ncbi:histidine phosphatase family protein [Candidatus Woesearchaeota archaeon]|nr:histidine phosphatase family protein [Candidatus Woesearchaeota archaeon]